MKRVLFLCTGNACRSQMAEGWANQLFGDRLEAHSAGVSPHGVDRLEAHSAGVSPHGVDPRAIQVMAESGVDMSAHRSKHVDELRELPFDLVVTVCDNAAEACPVFPGAMKKIHRGFDDPPKLAEEAAPEIEILEHYRRVRDEIRAFIENLPAHFSD